MKMNVVRLVLRQRLWVQINASVLPLRMVGLLLPFCSRFTALRISLMLFSMLSDQIYDREVRPH